MAFQFNPPDGPHWNWELEPFCEMAGTYMEGDNGVTTEAGRDAFFNNLLLGGARQAAMLKMFCLCFKPVY